MSHKDETWPKYTLSKEDKKNANYATHALRSAEIKKLAILLCWEIQINDTV